MKKYVQITAGRGPVDCARAVTLVARELLKDIPWLTLADCEPHNSEPDCFMSMTFVSEQPLDQAVIERWQGTAVWRSTKNRFRPGHKRSNWFVGISFIDEVTLPRVDDSDIVYESCRSGGKGGQNVNKVETAVRAIHLPSGISVKCSDERSQLQNKHLARRRLMLKLQLHNRQLIAQSRQADWSRHDALSRGCPVKKFSGPL